MITQSYLKECLHYDAETGVMIWRIRPLDHFMTAPARKTWNTRFAGFEVGTITETHGLEYRQVMLGGKFYKAHRLAWLYETGAFPETHTDHINGNGLDNRMVNLREATNAVNHQNMKRPSTNKTGVIGVHMMRGKYLAQIGAGGKTRHLGTFACLTAAAIARKAAELELGYHPNHGRVSA